MPTRRYKKRINMKNKTARRKYLSLKKHNTDSAKRYATRAALAAKSSRNAAYSAALM